MNNIDDIEKASIKELYKVQDKNTISISIMSFGIFIVFAFLSNDIYLGITKYFYFPVITILFLIPYVLKKNFKYKIAKLNVEQLCSFFLLIYLIISLIRYDSGLSRGVYLSYTLFLLIFLLFTLKKVNKKEIRFLINAFILSGLIISSIIIIFRQEDNNWIGTYRYTVKSIDVFIDPNFIGSFTVISAIFSFNRIFHGSKLRSFIYIFYTLIIMFAVFLTGSRAAMIALIIGCCIVFVSNTKLNLKYFLLGIFIITFLCFVLYKILPYGTIERMFFNSYNDDSNSLRLINWQYGWKSFLKYPIFGSGLMETNKILFNNFGYTHAVHNTYLAFLNQFGIVGCIPILIILVKISIISVKYAPVLLGVLFPLFFTSIMIEQNVTITFWSVIIILSLVKSFIFDNPEVKIEEIL